MTWNCLRKTHGTKETVALAAAMNSHRAERIKLNSIAVNVEDRTKQKNMDNLSWPNITENMQTSIKPLFTHLKRNNILFNIRYQNHYV